MFMISTQYPKTKRTQNNVIKNENLPAKYCTNICLISTKKLALLWDVESDTAGNEIQQTIWWNKTRLRKDILSLDYPRKHNIECALF